MKVKYELNLSQTDIDLITKSINDESLDAKKRKRFSIIMDLYLGISYDKIAEKHNIAKGTVLNLRKKFVEYGFRIIEENRLNSRTWYDKQIKIGDEIIEKKYHDKIKDILKKKIDWTSELLSMHLDLFNIKLKKETIDFIIEKRKNKGRI